MIKNLNEIKIGELWNQRTGKSIKTDFDLNWDQSDLNLIETLKGDLQILRIKEGVSVQAQNLESTAELKCTKCLESFAFPFKIQEIERLFYEEMPENESDPFEFFLINLKKLTIDLTEMFRQEIILHFPTFPVCSVHCQGLCPSCKINLNFTNQHLPECSGQKVDSAEKQENKPFANLKDLLK